MITTAGKLPAQHVIHTVGPTWNGGESGEPEKLRNCYLNSLALANEYKLNTVAFPNISTGVYRYPKAAAAQIAIQAVEDAPKGSVEKVIFVCFDQENYALYYNLLFG